MEQLYRSRFPHRSLALQPAAAGRAWLRWDGLRDLVVSASEALALLRLEAGACTVDSDPALLAPFPALSKTCLLYTSPSPRD